MNHVSVKSIESKTCPGVRFVIKRMTKRRADALNEQQALFRERLRPLYEEVAPLDKERAESKTLPDDKLKRWAELVGQIGKIDQNELEPAAVRFCLVRIEDMDITYPGADGQDRTEPATLDLVMEHGPDEMYAEILHEIERECGLLPEEKENLSSASTSAVAEAGIQDNAVPAEMPATTTPGPV